MDNLTSEVVWRKKLKHFMLPYIHQLFTLRVSTLEICTKKSTRRANNARYRESLLEFTRRLQKLASSNTVNLPQRMVNLKMYIVIIGNVQLSSLVQFMLPII